VGTLTSTRAQPSSFYPHLTFLSRNFLGGWVTYSSSQKERGVRGSPLLTAGVPLLEEIPLPSRYGDFILPLKA
jgi:hypothetical protein